MNFRSQAIGIGQISDINAIKSNNITIDLQRVTRSFLYYFALVLSAESKRAACLGSPFTFKLRQDLNS